MSFKPANFYLKCKLKAAIPLDRVDVKILPAMDALEFGKPGWPVWVFGEQIGHSKLASGTDKPLYRWVILFAVGKAINMPEALLKEYVEQLRTPDGKREVDRTEVPKRIHKNLWEAVVK